MNSFLKFLLYLKESVRLINIISKGVYRAASREKLMYGFLILSIFFVYLAGIAFILPSAFQQLKEFGNFTPLENSLSIGITWINIFLMLISIFVTLTVLQEFLSKENLGMLLSKPIQRWHIIEGIFWGIFKILLLNCFIMSASLWLVIYYLGGRIVNYIWLATAVTLFLSMVYTSLVIFFFVLIPNAISGILAFFVIIAGFGASLIEEGKDIFINFPVWFSRLVNLGIQILPKINFLLKISMKSLKLFAIEYINIPAVIHHTVLFLACIHILFCLKFSLSKK